MILNLLISEMHDLICHESLLMLVVYCYNTILLLFYQREAVHIGHQDFWDFYGTIGLLEILN